MFAHLKYLIKLIFSKKKKLYTFLYVTFGFIPSKSRLYEYALIHRSTSVFNNGISINNERLEYLGDAILGAVVAEYLFIHYPYKNEGFLSKIRSKIVNREMMEEVAVNIGLDQFVQSQSKFNQTNKYIHGNALEAIIGAVFLDKGYRRTRDFIITKILKKHLNIDELIITETNFKSSVLEWGQKNNQEISFVTVDNENESNGMPLFVSTIYMNEKVIGRGKGNSKKEAEQNASKVAYELIDEKKNTALF
ncbi:ribonuclease III [Bacteroidota bacterium]